MKLLRYLLAALALGWASTVLATSAAAATLRAVLVVASPEKGASDPRLAAYEGTLKRVLRFNSFVFQGSDSAEVAPNGKAALIIGQGHDLVVESGDNPLAIRIRWTEAGQLMMNTGLTLRAGTPAILGGPATGRHPGEVYAVILVMQ